MVKSVKFHVISGVLSYKSGHIYKILRGMNTFCMAYLYLLMVVWVVLQVFWPANLSASDDRAVGSGGFCLSPVIIACLM
jgi:hypothetical protein